MTFERPPSGSLTLRMARVDTTYTASAPASSKLNVTPVKLFRPFLELLPLALVLAFRARLAVRWFADIRRLSWVMAELTLLGSAQANLYFSTG